MKKNNGFHFIFILIKTVEIYCNNDRSYSETFKRKNRESSFRNIQGSIELKNKINFFLKNLCDTSPEAIELMVDAGLLKVIIFH